MMKLDAWQEEVMKTEGNIHLRAGRQVGKSTIISCKASEYAVSHRKKTVMVIAFTERQAYLLFEKILFYLQQKYPKNIKRGVDRPTKHIIKLTNGTQIVCVPTGMTGFGIMGYTIDLLIADEAAFIPDDVYNAVIPSLAVSRGTIWLLSTPCGSVGYFYEASQNDTYTKFHISSEDCPRKDAAFLEREKNRLSKLEYAQWYLGEFVTAFNRVFSDELIKKTCVLKTRSHSQFGTYYCGCDIARFGEDLSTFAVIEKINKENFEQIYSDATQNTRLTVTEDKLVDLNRIYNLKAIGIDAGAGSLGVGVLDHLLRVSSVMYKVVALNNRSISLDRDERQSQRLLKEDMYFNLLALMERHQIKLLDDDEIILSLKSIQYEYIVEKGIASRIRISGNYSHHAEGIIRAVWLATSDKRLELWAA